MKFQLPIKPRPKGARRKSLAERNESSVKTPVTHGYVKSFDGTKLFYSVEGKGKPLVFCYGLVCSSLHWTYQIEHFRKDYQTIWFDYRGHQNSEIPKDLSSLTVENLARDLKTVMDELEINDAVILGHSLGVNVVLDFYHANPKRVTAMVLANGTSKQPLETLFRQNTFLAAFNLLKKAHEKSPAAVNLLWKMGKGNPFARSMIAIGGFNPHLTPQEDIERYVDQVADMDPAILIQLINSYSNSDASSWLHTVNVPTMIVAGEQDKVTPTEQQELMHQLISGSQLEVIPHGSHCPQMDLPDLVNLKIEKFLNEIKYVTDPTHSKETASRSSVKRPNPDRAALS